jgi:hypothetical protein
MSRDDCSVTVAPLWLVFIGIKTEALYPISIYRIVRAILACLVYWQAYIPLWPSPLASLGSETATPPNIRTLFSEDKEDTSEKPGDISGKTAEISEVDPWRRSGSVSV